jgi:sarcosine oxidase subunit gamma
VFAEGVDVSHRQVALVLEGAGAEPLLNGAVPIDLSVAAFPVGMCSRTILGKVEIVLWRRDAAVWHIEVARSLAPYAQALLDTIGAASG